MEGVGGVTTQDWNGRSVLVTGATGMVGSALTRRLIDLGANVVAFVADIDPHSELYRSGTHEFVSVVNGRLEDVGAVERAVVGHDVDMIFHLGAQTIVSTAHRSPRATFESNVQGTWNVLDVARIHASLVTTVVVASSDKAYGESPVLPYVESMPLQGTFPYEVSKSMTDLVTRSYAMTYDLPAVIARCGNIYGPGDLNWSRIVPGTFRSIILGQQPVLRSDGTFLRDYLHVDDVVSAYLLLAGAAPDHRGAAFNFSDETPVSVLDIYRACCRGAGVPDLEPLILNAATGEIKDQYLDASAARNELGWTASTNLDEGLRRTFDWYSALLGRLG
jgi:CDP-glucose 4,6-dehydratase